MKLNKALIGGSIILVVTFGIFNVLNYVFHLGMLRMLTVAEYGVLATLLAIVYIVSIFTESIQTVLVKYSARENNLGKAKNLFMRSLHKAFLIAFVLFVLYILVAIKLASLMNIPYPLMVVSGTIIFAMFLTAVGRGILQGRQNFRALGSTMVLEGAIKVILGIAFVYIGWKVCGAVIGAVLGVFAAFIYTLIVLRPLLRARESHVATPAIYEYSLPVFLIMFTILVFYNLDILIAKIMFDAETAGLYAIIAVIAKTVFFATQPISRAMFPMTAEKMKQGLQSNVFRSALIILLACIALAFILFYFFPEFIVWVFTGKSLPVVANLIIYAVLAASFLALANLVILYRLSQGRIRHAAVFLLFVITEAILLYIFSDNLTQFVLAYMTAAAIFLWGSVVLLKQ